MLFRVEIWKGRDSTGPCQGFGLSTWGKEQMSEYQSEAGLVCAILPSHHLFSPWLEVNLYFSSGLCSPFQNTGWLLSQFFSLFHQIVHFFPLSACNSFGFQILMCRKGKGKLHLACLNFYYNSLKLLLKWTAIKTCYNFGKLCLFLSFVLALASLEMCCLVVC